MGNLFKIFFNIQGSNLHCFLTQHNTLLILNSFGHTFTAEVDDPDIFFLNEELKNKTFIEKLKYIGNEWVDGWEKMKSCGGWKEGGKKLFQLSFVLWILR